MTWEFETVINWLVTSSNWIAPAGTLVTIFIAIWIFVLGGLKTVSSWFRPQSKPEDSVAIVDILVAITEKKVLAEQERDELLKTVKALQQQTGPSSEEALAALKAGQTDKAEALFISIAEGLQKTGSKAYTEAAEAWRHVGALAFLHDTQKALDAYFKAVELDPDNADGWNQLAKLQMRVGKLDAAERSFLKVLSLGNRSADKSVIAMATGNLGLIHQTRGDLDQACQNWHKARELFADIGMPHMVEKVEAQMKGAGCAQK